jgi:hypothetical protein
MKPLLLLVIFFSFNAFAKGELLRKFARTGRVDPQDSFTKECMVNQNGIVNITTQLADAPPVETGKRISPHLVQEIRRLLHAAKYAEVTEEPFPCDAGTRTLEGFLGSQIIELDLAVNCRSHRVNQSLALPRLKAISTVVCGF